jgi:RNA-directed DNA polymerase
MIIKIKKVENWSDIEWAEINTTVYVIQNKIYQAALENKQNSVNQLQMQLINSMAAKLLAVRTVTQDNRGKKTAGIDGVLVVRPNQRLELAKNLNLDCKASQVLRVFVPKGNPKHKKFRPLGIPTIHDRIKQTLVKLALEPEWEAKFEPNSYGFRPGYSVFDAKWVIARQLQGAPKYFLDADIENCFENVNHLHLLNKLENSEIIKNQIMAWLSAGVYDSTGQDSCLTKTKGIPQGGSVSPLLMNISLNGLETALTVGLPKRDAVKFVRYADDFVVFTKNYQDCVLAKKIVEAFLAPIGLNLSAAKTRIGHSLENMPGCSGPIGLDFLSFNFTQVKCSIHKGTRTTQNKPTKFKLITRPSRNSVKEHKNKLSVILKKNRQVNLEILISKFADQIKGWTWYHAVTQCTKTFSKIDSWFWNKLWKWAKNRFKRAKTAIKKCFSVRNWQFGFVKHKKTKKEKIFILNRHDQTNVRKHIKIKDGYSFYNNDLKYFANRMVNESLKIRNLTGLFKKQKHKCFFCAGLILPGDIVEIHHILEADSSKQTGEIKFVHGYCHDVLHKTKKKI